MWFDYDKEKNRYIRIKRPIYSQFWRFVHNTVAHPMLAIYRPWGQKLHEWTAEKMYEKTDEVVGNLD